MTHCGGGDDPSAPSRCVSHHSISIPPPSLRQAVEYFQVAADLVEEEIVRAVSHALYDPGQARSAHTAATPDTLLHSTTVERRRPPTRRPSLPSLTRPFLLLFRVCLIPLFPPMLPPSPSHQPLRALEPQRPAVVHRAPLPQPRRPASPQVLQEHQAGTRALPGLRRRELPRRHTGHQRRGVGGGTGAGERGGQEGHGRRRLPVREGGGAGRRVSQGGPCSI